MITFDFELFFFFFFSFNGYKELLSVFIMLVSKTSEVIY